MIVADYAPLIRPTLAAFSFRLSWEVRNHVRPSNVNQPRIAFNFSEFIAVVNICDFLLSRNATCSIDGSYVSFSLLYCLSKFCNGRWGTCDTSKYRNPILLANHA